MAHQIVQLFELIRGWLIVWIGVGIAFTLMGCATQPEAIAPDAAPLSPQLTASASVTRAQPPPEAVLNSVRQAIADQHSVSPDDIQIGQSHPSTWSDGCLELPQPGEFCTQALVDGWQIEAIYNNDTWIYHTDQTGDKIRRQE